MGFRQVKKLPPHHKAFLKIILVVNKLIATHCIYKKPYQLTKDDLFFVVGPGLDVKKMEEPETVEYSDLALQLVYPGSNCQVARKMATLAQEQPLHENSGWDSDLVEVLYNCYLYDAYGYDMCAQLDFEIVLSTLAAGRDMQISEDVSLEVSGKKRGN